MTEVNVGDFDIQDRINQIQLIFKMHIYSPL